MSDWKYMRLYPNQIKTKTDSAALIKMPPGSEFSGWMFWHPLKCIHEHPGKMTEMIYKPDFTFRMKRYGTKPYNKYEVQEQRTISASALEDAFSMNGDVYFEDEEPLIYTPEKIDPEGTVANEDLIDDE